MLANKLASVCVFACLILRCQESAAVEVLNDSTFQIHLVVGVHKDVDIGVYPDPNPYIESRGWIVIKPRETATLRTAGTSPYVNAFVMVGDLPREVSIIEKRGDGSRRFIGTKQSSRKSFPYIPNNKVLRIENRDYLSVARKKKIPLIELIRLDRSSYEVKVSAQVAETIKLRRAELRRIEKQERSLKKSGFVYLVNRMGEGLPYDSATVLRTNTDAFYEKSTRHTVPIFGNHRIYVDAGKVAMIMYDPRTEGVLKTSKLGYAGSTLVFRKDNSGKVIVQVLDEDADFKKARSVLQKKQLRNRSASTTISVTYSIRTLHGIKLLTEQEVVLVPGELENVTYKPLLEQLYVSYMPDLRGDNTVKAFRFRGGDIVEFADNGPFKLKHTIKSSVR